MRGVRKDSAFTLIELLVTIAIISVLASMLLPSLGRAKGKAQGGKCLSNSRQLGIGLMLYVEDHNQSYPPSADYSAATDDPARIWNMKLITYLQSTAVYICPTVRNFNFPSNWAARGHGSIGYTTATAYDPKSVEGFPEFTTSSHLKAPSLTPLFGDTPAGPTELKYRGFTFDPYNGAPHESEPALGAPLVAPHDLVPELSALPPAALKPLQARHHSRVILILADGHASAHASDAITRHRDRLHEWTRTDTNRHESETTNEDEGTRNQETRCYGWGGIAYRGVEGLRGIPIVHHRDRFQ